MTNQKRIKAERKALNLRPWELAPSECDDGPSPWPPGTMGFISWRKAQALRREMKETP